MSAWSVFSQILYAMTMRHDSLEVLRFETRTGHRIYVPTENAASSLESQENAHHQPCQDDQQHLQSSPTEPGNIRRRRHREDHTVREHENDRVAKGQSEDREIIEVATNSANKCSGVREPRH